MRYFQAVFVILSLTVTNSFSQTSVFIENKGQIFDQYSDPRTDIDVILRGHGFSAAIGQSQIHYQFISSPIVPNSNERQLEEMFPSRVYRMDVELLGSNKLARITKQNPNPYFENYYLSGSDDRGITASAYEKITYHEVYPGIDWVLYFKEGKLEQDFIVRPNGNPDDIRLKYSGTTSLKIKADGTLEASTPLGSITENAPKSVANGKEIETSYVLDDNILSFNLADYTGTLVIDPTLEWATYFGGNNEDIGGCVSCDNQGNVYMGGATKSTLNLATMGAHDINYSAQYDAFLSKFDANGVLLWATYYGGNGDETIETIACDNNMNVIVCGSTKSTDAIASTGCHQPNFGGNQDGFLAQFNSSGVRQWGTYYGGPALDQGMSVYCDPANNIYLAGGGNSTSDIATTGSYQPFQNGGGESYLAKFNSSGTRIWATYIGGSGNDAVRKVTGDIWGNVYIGGITSSLDHIATPGRFKTSFTDNSDAFLMKFNAAGDLMWGTYCGGNLSEEVGGLACDKSGHVYISGQTSSTDIATQNAYQTNFAGGNLLLGDAFLIQFDSSGANRNWATYFGGPDDEGRGLIACDSVGSIYIVGSTRSNSGIATVMPFQANQISSGDYAAFIAKFTSAGICAWSTYFGWVTYGYGIATSGATKVYVCGLAGITPSIPVTSGCLKPVCDNGDAYLAKFNVESLEVPSFTSSLSGLSIWPNPNNGIFNLSANVNATSPIRIEVANLLGQPVYNGLIPVKNFRIDHTIDMQEQPNGLYTISIFTTNDAISVPFIKR